MMTDHGNVRLNSPANRPLALSSALLLVLMMLGSSGCSSDGLLSGGGGPGEGQPDAGTPTSDTSEGDDGGEVDEPEPDLVEEPEDIVVVTVDPVDTVYRPGRTVTLNAELWLATDEVITGGEYEWSTDPENAAELVEGNDWTLIEEGPTIFIACTTYNGVSICGGETVIVDAGPPTIELYSPVGGEFLFDPVVEVRGRVIETGFIPRVFLRGEELEVDEEGIFTGQFNARFGINHVEVTANDGVNDREARAAADVIYAIDYYPSEDIEANHFEFDPALVVRLGRDFFDDGVPYLDVPDSLVAETSDLVGIVELVLAEADYNALLPNPAADEEMLYLEITDLVIEQPIVELTIIETGLELFIQLNDIVMSTDGQLRITDNTPLDLKGDVWATASAYALLTVQKLDGEPAVVAVEEFGFAIEEADSSFGSAEADALFELAESLLRGVIEDAVTTAILDGVVDAIPEAVSSIFDMIGDSLSIDDVTLAVDPLPPVVLYFHGEMATITPKFNENIDVIMRAGLGTMSAATHPEAPGVPLTALYGSEPELISVGRIQIAIDLGLLNGLIYALWNSGMLELDVTGLSPAVALLADTAVAVGKLPPVISVGPDGALEITLGQFELGLTKGDESETWALSFQARAELIGSEEGLAIVLGDDPSIRAWLVARDAERPFFYDPSELEGMAEALIWPMLTDALSSELVIPIPEIDLSAMGDVAPRLDDLVTKFVVKYPIDLRGSHIVIDAFLQGQADLSD